MKRAQKRPHFTSMRKEAELPAKRQCKFSIDFTKQLLHEVNRFRFNDMRNEILGRTIFAGKLSDLAISRFEFMIEMLLQKLHSVKNRSRMQCALFNKYPHFYRSVSRKWDHIQIILADEHCIVSYYMAERGEVLLYDSGFVYGQQLTNNQKIIVERLYPGVSYRFTRPATTQPDNVSCGVFAIAYVLMLILFGRNPETHKIYLSEMNTGDPTKSLRETLVSILTIIENFLNA